MIFARMRSTQSIYSLVLWPTPPRERERDFASEVFRTVGRFLPSSLNSTNDVNFELIPVDDTGTAQHTTNGRSGASGWWGFDVSMQKWLAVLHPSSSCLLSLSLSSLLSLFGDRFKLPLKLFMFRGSDAAVPLCSPPSSSLVDRVARHAPTGRAVSFGCRRQLTPRSRTEMGERESLFRVLLFLSTIKPSGLHGFW